MLGNANLQERLAWHVRHTKHCSCHSIPPRTGAFIETGEAQAKRKPAPLRRFLAGGDRRSVAESDVALKILRQNPARISELVELSRDDDWLVSMRAMDILEKLAHKHPDWIAPHKQVFLGELANSDKWEIRLQIVRALPLFDWTPIERRRVIEILLRDVTHPQKFVKSWALDSLATLSEWEPTLRPVVRRYIEEFRHSGSRALASRAVHVRQRLSLETRRD
jgi:hypothetical protein